MSGHLCLKWNNHSTAFLNSISKIQIKEKYCDSTIVCQGKYFPVHRVILSTCSDYFEEMFERISCPHPYIVFKDIEPEEMGLLLNYMYQGEVNVIQEKLPSLIKAAEALKIKGLAVPDDLPTSNKESSGRKRSHQSDENSQSKRRHEEKRKRSSELNTDNKNDVLGSMGSNAGADEDEPKIIKDEPLDTYEYVEATPISSDFSNTEEMPSNNPLPSVSDESQVVNKEDTEFPMEGAPFIKSEDTEPPPPDESYDDQSSWTNYGDSDMQNLNMPQTSQQDDEYQDSRCSENEEGKLVTSSGIPKTLDASGRLAYRCPYCPYENYSCSTNVKSHIRYKHMRDKPFRCSICSKGFPEKFVLVRHMRIHTGEKPFSCSSCPKSFSDQSSLRRHKRIHTGERPFQCPVCLKRFTYKSTLVRHSVIHTTPAVEDATLNINS